MLNGMRKPAWKLMAPDSPHTAKSGRGWMLPKWPWRRLISARAPCLVLVGVRWAIWPSQPSPAPLHLAAGALQADLLSPD